MGAMAVRMSLGLGLGSCVTLIGAWAAAAHTIFGRAGLGIFPLAIRTNAADHGVGAHAEDGPVVHGEGVRCACDGREKRVGSAAVAAGVCVLRHFAIILSRWTNGINASLSILLMANGAGIPEVHAVTRKGFLRGIHIFAGDGVRVAEDVADVVVFRSGVRFDDASRVIIGGFVTNENLSVK